ncbi:MAG: exonuclease SbcCD subunit D [Desulfurivibrionaceae bacterium]
MKEIFTSDDYQGLLAIGDPHLEGRVPGFRRDDYPGVILEKLRWALDYARQENLLPLLLGDIFHLPRNNPNWLLVKVIQLLNREIVGIYGNHDVHENRIGQDDSISVVAESGRIILLDTETVVKTRIRNREVIIGGTPWGCKLPDGLDLSGSRDSGPSVIWLCHHDLKVPGYEEQGYIRPRELSGIDLVVNGHIHRHLEEVRKGETLWLTPGSISRRARSDAARSHRPSVLLLEPGEDDWSYKRLEVPHRPFEEVFYDAVLEEDSEEEGSAFVAGLAELQARKTETGAGLKNFLEKNLSRFDEDIAGEVLRLAEEVTDND